MATVIPPLLPLEAPNDNEQSLWTMIIAMRRALFGLGGPLTIFAGNQGTGGTGGAGGVPCEDTNPCSGNPVFQSQGGIPNGDSDTFDRAALCGTANNLGGPWVVTTTDNNQFCIVQDPTRDAGGALRISNSASIGVVYHNGDWADDQKVSIFLASTAGVTPAPTPQIGLRINPCTLNTSNPNVGYTGYTVQANIDQNLVVIHRFNSGVDTTLFSAGDGSADPQSMLAGDTLTVSIVGRVISVQVLKGINWPLAQRGQTVTRVNFTDNTPLLNGRVGFFSNNTSPGRNIDIQNWVGASLGSIISGGNCGGGNPNTINPTNAGTVLVLTSGGQIGWPCKETLLVDAVNRRIVGSSQPRGNLTLASTCNATKGRVIIQNPDIFRIGALTQGSVLFAGSNGDVSQDNANFFYDQPNTRLRVPNIAGGTAATSSLNLQSTTGIGTTDFIRFLVGNAGSTEAMRIIDNGFVGIRTATPTTILHILSAVGISASVTIASGDSTTTSNINLQSAGVLKWGLSDRNAVDVPNDRLSLFNNAITEVMTWLQGGNIGIGVSNPATQLDLSGTGRIRIQSGTATGPATGLGVEIGCTATPLGFIIAFNRNTSAWLDMSMQGLTDQFSTNGLERMRIDSSGNVGINTSIPNTLLDINGAISTRKLDVTLANGANENVAISTFSLIRVIGPTAAYSVGGFANGFDGRKLYLFNSVAQQLTINNADAGSAAANQITTLTGANVVLRAGTSYATFIYDGASSKWILVATN